MPIIQTFFVTLHRQIKTTKRNSNQELTMTRKAKETIEAIKIAIGIGIVALLGLLLLMAIAQ